LYKYWVEKCVDEMTVFEDKPIEKTARSINLRRPIAGGTAYGIHPERYTYWRVGYGARESFPLAFWIERVGEFCGKPNYVTGDFHWTHSLQIFYHRSGQAVFEFDHQTVSVEPGSMMIVPPHQLFSYRGPSIHYDWLAVDGQWPEILGDATSIRYLKLGEDQQLRAKFTEIREALILQQIGYPIQTVGLFYELVARMEGLMRGPLETQSAYPEVVRSAMLYLAENYTERFDAALTAAAVNVSTSHLRALFKQWLGESPRQYHTRYRLDQARRLLKEQRLSISEVALAVGYDDVRYFSRVFKRFSGVSPSEYSE
ncbi:MAG: AraC family transcriptional regulator, partial [Chloroflexota bacterium]